MRIAISGAQGTGKTTLLNKLNELEGLKDYEFKREITRILREQGYKINEEGDDNTQLKMIGIHLKNIDVRNAVYDRCILDVLVYTHYLFMNGNCKLSTLDTILDIVKDNISKYDVIFYIEPEFDIENDNVRSTNVKFRDDIVKIFQYYIKTLEIPVIKLRGSVDDRIKTILTFL